MDGGLLVTFTLWTTVSQMKDIKVDGGLLVSFTLWTTISQMKYIKVDGRFLVSFTVWTTISEIPVFPSLFKVVVSEWVSQSCSVMSNSLRPHGCYRPRNSPGQNTGVGSLSLLQGIFPTQGSNPGLPHCRRILYQLSHKVIVVTSNYSTKNRLCQTLCYF